MKKTNASHLCKSDVLRQTEREHVLTNICSHFKKGILMPQKEGGRTEPTLYLFSYFPRPFSYLPLRQTGFVVTTSATFPTYMVVPKLNFPSL
jgi:hypothetical protein